MRPAVLIVLLVTTGCSAAPEIGSDRQVRSLPGGHDFGRATVATYASFPNSSSRDSVRVRVFAPVGCSASPALFSAAGWRVGWTAETGHELDDRGEAVLPHPGRLSRLYIGKGRPRPRPDLATPLDLPVMSGVDTIIVWLTGDRSLCDVT